MSAGLSSLLPPPRSDEAPMAYRARCEEFLEDLCALLGLSFPGHRFQVRTMIWRGERLYAEVEEVFPGNAA